LDDPRGFKAQQTVEQLDGELMRYWAEKRARRDPDAEARYPRARQTAQKLGFSYAPAAEGATLPITDILRRIETLEARKSVDKAPEIVAVLGGEPPPAIMVGNMVDEFEKIILSSLTKKSERQRKKRRVARDSALATFIDVIGGDRPIKTVTRTDALALRSFWQERIVNGEVEIDTANKSIGRVASMFKAIDENRQLDLPRIFDNLESGVGRIDSESPSHRSSCNPGYLPKAFSPISMQKRVASFTW
jgi:hypothetical protein